MRSICTMALAGVIAIGACASLARRARADDVHDLELTLPIGVVDRTSGVTGVPAGYGYENTSGLLTGIEGRLFWGPGGERIFHLGLMVGAQQQAGALLGLVDGDAFRTTLMEAGLAGRVLLPCLSRGDVKWRLGGVLALVGAYADAGAGVGGRDNGPAADERARAAASLDHGGLGWRLAIDLSWHVESFVIGVGAGVRQYFAIDSPVRRVWLADVGLRIGARFDLASSPPPYDRFAIE